MTAVQRENGIAAKYGLTVLYEDNHLLVVEKPVNIPVQADISGDEDLCTKCRNYLKEAGNKPGDAYLGIVHRLDRPVGGVMVFAKTSKAAARLTAQFKNHSTSKRYVAIVCGKAKAEDCLSDYLLKDEKTNTTSVVEETVPGAKYAKLSYEKMGEDGNLSLLDIVLYTGRPHQIRVQLSHAGLPIFGDQRYHPDAIAAARNGGSSDFRRTQICLWSYALTLEHPTLGERMTFFSIPKGREWDRFSAQMEMLPAFSVCTGLYVDKDLIAVDKRKGVEVEDGLSSELESLFAEIYPVHRLDANTQGVVLFARNAGAREKLENAFYYHDIRKVYRAVVVGKPEPEHAHLKNYALKNADSATVTLCGPERKGALRMELDYRVLKSGNGCSLVEIELQTGRTHQIRVQMAAAGYPVLGDDKYGNREANRTFRRRTQELLCKRIDFDGKTFASYKDLDLPEKK